jgi:hypothetical protein
MNAFCCDDLEIVGFNGAPLVECGRALPVAMRKSDGLYCVLELPSGTAPIAWHTKEEADAYAASRRWTQSRLPLILPRSCLNESEGVLVRQPMVVFADEAVLDTADRVPRPDLLGGDYLIWCRLQGYPDTLQATCGAQENIEWLLDEWSAALLKRFEAMYHHGRDRSYMKRIADFALCAARSRTLRWKSYLRYALVQDPDHVRRTFESFTQREFPNVDWKSYLKELKSLSDVLKNVSVPARQPAPPSSLPTALSKLHGMAAARPSLTLV